MEIIARIANLPGALPGACAQGLIWGIMAIGVYLTYRILDVADLTVDGSFGTGGAVCVMCLLSGMNVWAALLVAVLAGLATGLVTGLLHTFMGIPAILAGILTQLALYSINLKIMGKANQSINVDKYGLLISLRWVKEFALHNPIIMVILATAVVIGVLYWFFGTELGCGIRATGSNPAMSRAQGINTSTSCWDWLSPMRWWRCPVRCSASIRALQMSAWDAVPSSSVWLPSSSARPCLAASSITLPSSWPRFPSVPSSTISSFSWC